ncbi:MAG: hypothetical protein HFH49_02955 [Lachnospiraceae bacterium]|nr:hypothetical protein [Lachnospiraceae bacterium]
MRNIKNTLTVIKVKISAAIRRFRDYRKRNWNNTARLLYWCAVLLFSFSLGLLAGGFMYPRWAGALLVFLAAVPLTMLAVWIAERLLHWLFRENIRERICWLLLWMVCLIVMTAGSYTAGFGKSAAISLAVSLIFTLMLKSLWALLGNKLRTRSIVFSLVASSVFMGAVCLLLAGEGFSDSYVERYLQCSREAGAGNEPLTEREQQEFRQEMEEGPYQVLTLTYGTTGTEDLESDTANISRFAENQGIGGFFKERYQGYPLTEVPLSGIIWYPEEISNCPALFLIHGNHSWLTDSYLGYEYLGKYLASHGYAVVSVDENACNSLSGENDGRAVLLLENIRQVETYNQKEGGPMYHKIDYEHLALAGHSRGGEAIALAYLFNDLNFYPDNGNRRFQYHFSIQSLIAIAPTCGQYQPSDRSVELEDVNYLLLHGANDQDVNTFMGMEQYENISFTGTKDCIKTSLYLAGLNHGQFNSLWGKYDMMEPLNRMLNVGNFLPQQQQQQIAKIFIKSFLDRTLAKAPESAGAKASKGLLTNWSRYRSLLPETLYVQSYQTSDFKALCNFEEDARIDSGTAEGVRIRAQHVDSWREELLRFSNEESRGNYAAVLKWSAGKEEGENTGESNAAASNLKRDAEREEWENTGESNAGASNLKRDAEREEWENTGEFNAGVSYLKQDAEKEERRKQEETAEYCISFPEFELEGKALQFDLMDLREDFSEEEAEPLEVEIWVKDQTGAEACLSGKDYAVMYPPFMVRQNKLQYLWKTTEYKHQFQTVSVPLADFEGIDSEKICQIRLCFPQKEGKVAIDNVGVLERVLKLLSDRCILRLVGDLRQMKGA